MMHLPFANTLNRPCTGACALPCGQLRVGCDGGAEDLGLWSGGCGNQHLRGCDEGCELSERNQGVRDWWVQLGHERRPDDRGEGRCDLLKWMVFVTYDFFFTADDLLVPDLG